MFGWMVSSYVLPYVKITASFLYWVYQYYMQLFEWQRLCLGIVKYSKQVNKLCYVANLFVSVADNMWRLMYGSHSNILFGCHSNLMCGFHGIPLFGCHGILVCVCHGILFGCHSNQIYGCHGVLCTLNPNYFWAIAITNRSMWQWLYFDTHDVSVLACRLRPAPYLVWYEWWPRVLVVWVRTAQRSTSVVYSTWALFLLFHWKYRKYDELMVWV